MAIVEQGDFDMKKKLSRRNFIGLLGAFAALSPVLLIGATPIKKKKITVKLLPDRLMVESKKRHPKSWKNIDCPDLPHGNSPDECYNVYESDKFVGVLQICYQKIRCSEIRDRQCTSLSRFETFFGMNVELKEIIIFSKGIRSCEREAQDEKDILPIAEKLVKMAIEKTEKLIEKYKEYKND
jgi:hypothetical protein